MSRTLTPSWRGSAAHSDRARGRRCALRPGPTQTEVPGDRQLLWRQQSTVAGDCREMRLGQLLPRRPTMLCATRYDARVSCSTTGSVHNRSAPHLSSPRCSPSASKCQATPSKSFRRRASSAVQSAAAPASAAATEVTQKAAATIANTTDIPAATAFVFMIVPLGLVLPLSFYVVSCETPSALTRNATWGCAYGAT